MKEMLNERGIELTFSSPYCPQENGQAERTNESLLNLTRTLLIASKLPNFLWAECVSTSARMLNITTICKATGRPAYEEIYGREPLLSKLRPFGAKCIVYNDDRNKNKLNPRGVNAILIGYAEGTAGFRLWIPENRTVRTSKNVRFLTPAVFPEKANDGNGGQSKTLESETEPSAPVTSSDGDAGSIPENENEPGVAALGDDGMPTDETADSSEGTPSIGTADRGSSGTPEIGRRSQRHQKDSHNNQPQRRYNLRDRATLRPPEK